MRFVRTLAAAAILGCSMVAGQAGASGRGTTIIHLQSDPTQTPLSSLDLQIGYGGLYGITGPLLPFNLGHWVAGRTIDPRFRISSIYGASTAQADTLTLRLFKYKAPLSERISYFNFDFAPGSFAAIGTFQSIGALDATMRVDYIAQPAVPEPSTWALMIFGFGGIGAVMRRRRNGAFRRTFSDKLART